MIDLQAHVQRYAIQGRRGADAFREAVGPYLNNPVLEFEPGSKDITAQISLCRLNKIQIFSGAYKQAFRLLIPDARSFVQTFPFQGSGQVANNGIMTQASAGHGSVIEPGELDVRFSPEAGHVCVFLNPAALTFSS